MCFFRCNIAAVLCYNVSIVKKILALLTAVLSAFIFFACAAADVTFIGMDKVFSGSYEKAVYSAEINDGATEEKTVYTAASSGMTLVFEKLEGALASLTMDLTITYVSTPGYAAAKGYDYTGLTDTVHSEVVFNAYSESFAPVSVKKNAVLQTSAKYDKPDKSYTAEFTYPVGKNPGTGTYTNASGKKELSVKQGTLKNTFDNEQMYYMISSFMRSSVAADNSTLLGYSKQYQIFNAVEAGVNGSNNARSSVSFAVSETKLSSYNSVNSEGGVALVTAAFPEGRPTYLYYSLKDNLTAGGTVMAVRKHLLLGYEQGLTAGSSFSVTSYTLKSYSAQR